MPRLRFEMVSKEVEVAPPAGDVLKKGRRRRRRAGSRAAKRRAARKSATSPPGGAPAPVDKFVSPIKCAVHAFLLRYQSALRKVPTQLPPKVRAGPPTKRVKRVSWSKLPQICLISHRSRQKGNKQRASVQPW